MATGPASIHQERLEYDDKRKHKSRVDCRKKEDKKERRKDAKIEKNVYIGIQTSKLSKL